MYYVTEKLSDWDYQPLLFEFYLLFLMFQADEKLFKTMLNTSFICH